MARLAVDVVLLPDRAMTDFAIAANTEIVKNFGSEIVLNAKNCLPHISLAMGCIDSDDIIRIGQMLQELVSIVPKKLRPAGIQKDKNPSGQIVSVIAICRANELQNLHEKVCRSVKGFFTYDVTEEMTAGERVSRSTIEWIKDFPDKASYSYFSPHITIAVRRPADGYGELSERQLPADFTVSHLAICHLGNHCTCREILWSAEIPVL